MHMEKYPLDRYMAYNIIYGYSPHPLNNLIAVSIDISGQVNIWFYKWSTLPRRLTTFVERRAMPIAWSPDGDKLLFNVDYQGNEIWQLYIYVKDIDWYNKLISEEDVVHYTSGYCWNKDGDRFIYFANREDKTRFDLYLYGIDENMDKLIWKGFGGYQYPYWFFDDIAIIQDLRSHEDSSLYKINLSSGESEELTPHSGEVIYQPIANFGDGFFLISDMGRDFRYLAYYNLEKRTMKMMWSGDHDVELSDIGKDILIFSIDDESFSKLYYLDLNTMDIHRIYIPPGIVEKIVGVKGRNIFYILISMPHNPPELYVYNFYREEINRITDNFYGGIPREGMVIPMIEYYPSFDNKKIHTLIFKPYGEGPYPTLVYLHGGPQSEGRPRYSAFIQYMVSRGVAVVMPNFRGSTGFGKAFRNLINRDWGGGELRDIEYLVKYLWSKKWVDKNRIGVFGGSFGGFLTLSSISRLPEYWRVAAELFGPSNLVTFAKSVPPYWKRYMKKWVGDPDDPEDRKMLEERSPIKYIDNVKVPLMVIQGARDIRVVKSESDQVVDRLRNKGLEVKYIVYDDEGHGFTKEKNSKDAIKRIIDFLLIHLLQ